MTVERRISDWLTRAVAELLHLPADDIPTDLPFTALGLSSMQVLELSDRLQGWAGVELGPTVAYDHPDIDAISAHVAALSDPRTAAETGEPTTSRGGAGARGQSASRTGAEAGGPAGVGAGGVGAGAAAAGGEPVAVVGIGCRVPGAEGPEAFWTLLTDGVDAVGEVPADRWDPTVFDDPGGSAPERVNARWGGFLADVAGFDSEFFGVAAREAARMDPQQRLALEVAWESLEDAGIAPDRLSGSRTGVFMGVSSFDHGTAMFGSLADTQPYDGTGGALSIVANRVSYVLDLRGPSLVVDTACSSSLVAVHLACQALRGGEAELALAGGVNVITSPRIALSFSQGGLMAADGRCKPFDHRADGYVRSEGVGVVVLKPLSAAVADGDRIYAVIRGGAVNQDGRTNGLTAPNGPSQEAVLRAAYRAAGLPASGVGYVEAHGTGTAVGDPIEVAALAGVLGAGRTAERPLRIGSVKSNLGHLEAAAGVTGLIKTALALHHRRIPPTLHYEKPNPLLGLDGVPVTVVADTVDWPLRADGTPAPAGVSSFGFGGTNSHLVLSAAPEAPPAAPAPDGSHAPPRLIPLSARSADALPRRAAAWAAQARSATGDTGWLPRFGAAAAHRAEHAPHRAAVVAANAREAAEALEALAAGERGAHAVPARRIARHRPKVALVFPGQGSQWAGMGRRLALTVPEFREAVREADAAIARHLGRSLWSDEHGLVAESTAEVQPALFAMQVALAETWRAWGLRPAAVIGHSMGEIAAAQAAGALTLADAAAVVCERSRLLTEISGLGGLVLVELGEEEAAALIAGRERDLSVAALNGPRATVLSGTPAALDDVVARLDARGVFARRISVEFAAHSPQVEPLQPRLRAALTALAARDTEVALYSTVTGEAVRGHELGPDYWVTNVRAPVRFGPALGRLLADGCDTFVEIAPHPVLARPVADHLDETGRADTLVVSSLRRDEDEPRSLLTAVGNLYTAGVPVDWSALYPGTARHTPLARHGWRHQHFAIARLGEDRRRPAARPPGGRLLGARVPVGPEPALRLWELPLGPDTAPELLDHVVEDVPLVAGAYWLTAAAQAATVAAPGKPVALHEVSFAQPYPLDEERERPLQIGIRPGPDGREHFAVVSCPSEGRPVTHAEGVLGDVPGGAPPGRSEDLDAIRARCVTEVPVDDHYRRLAAAGLRYGPRFRALERLTVGDGEALARVRLPEGLDAGAPPLHPALLDSCLHTVAAATAEPGQEEALPLPVGADTVWSATEGAPLRTGWCHARLLDAGHGRIVADVTVLDDTGTPVWSATGFRVRLTAPRRRPEDGRLYEVRWTPYDSGPAAPDPGRWLLLADDASLGTAAGLAERLARAGARCETRRPGADSGFGDLTTAERDGPLRGIVDTRAAAVRPGATARDEAARTAAALEPVRAVTGGRWRHAAPRLWLLTAGTQDPTGVTGDELPAGAGLWGLGRTVGNEFPEPGCSLVDLDRDPTPRDLDAATAALLAAEPATQLAVRGGALTAPVLREAARDPLAEVPAPRADRTYVLTGGLGELGMRVARRLAGRGARHLLLIGRGAPSDAVARHLAELRATGCETRVARADVSDAESLRTALHGPHPGTGPARPPIGGVVHLAGVLADALLPDLSPRDLDRTFAGKAVGAWHLHELTREEPLEFFVLFSSLAGLIGSPGQGAYAAANSFLDALARRRAALGLPAHSIAWGTWAGASLAATGGGTDRLAARGVPPLEPGTGLELLDAALCGDRPQLAATALDPARLAAAGVWPSARELLAPLLAARQDEPPGTASARPGAVRAEILAAGAPAQRRQVMLDFLTDQVAQVLSARPGTVAADAPFHSMGLDSLMAIELRGRLESALGIRLSATLVYAHPTAGALADQLLSRLLPGGTGATGERDLSDGRGAAVVPPDETAAPPDPDSGLAHLDDSEVAALLAAELDVFEANGEE